MHRQVPTCRRGLLLARGTEFTADESRVNEVTDADGHRNDAERRWNQSVALEQRNQRERQ